MVDNTRLLQDLFAQNQIALENAPFLSTTPPSLPPDWSYNRIEGMLLGLAIGDALGNTSESVLPHDRKKQHGEIRDYLPNRYANYRAVGLPSDDTQMAFWTLERLLADGGLIPDRLAAEFTQHQIFGIGSTVRDFIHAFKDQGQPWHLAGQPSAGNGALMRIAPVVIPHLRQPSPALWADSALAGMLTHNDRASTASSVAFTYILWECLRRREVPEPRWWIEQFVAVARPLEGETNYVSRKPGAPYRGPLWRFVEQELPQALAADLSVLEACSRWYSGAYLLETVPCVVYILARHAAEPEEALVRAVNDTKDNDTIAAIVGAVLGALHGRSAWPARWVKPLLGRTGQDDDWRIFGLIEDAKQTFWQPDILPDPADIQVVLAYLPLLEQPGFSPGVWHSAPNTLPYFEYSPQALEFFRSLSQHNFVQPFDWMAWSEGERLTQEPALLENANLRTLQKLITAHVRSDRFSEGHLAGVIEDGHMLQILKRLQVLHLASRKN